MRSPICHVGVPGIVDTEYPSDTSLDLVMLPRQFPGFIIFAWHGYCSYARSDISPYARMLISSILLDSPAFVKRTVVHPRSFTAFTNFLNSCVSLRTSLTKLLSSIVPSTACISSALRKVLWRNGLR